MLPAWRRQLLRHQGKTLVEFCRRPKIQERITGYVVGFSDSLILVHCLDWNTFLLDGYTILRDIDIESKRFFTRPSYWQNRAIAKLELRPQGLPGLALEDWPSAIAGIADRFPLLHLESELTKPDTCYIGVPVKITEKLLILDNLDSSADWTGPWSFKLNEITRLDFGGGYERALALTAPPRRSKVIKKYGVALKASMFQGRRSLPG